MAEVLMNIKTVEDLNNQNIVLYSIGCPKCVVLEKKLDSIGAQYETNSNVDYMVVHNISLLPVLQINEEMLDFSQAVSLINRISNFNK